MKSIYLLKYIKKANLTVCLFLFYFSSAAQSVELFSNQYKEDYFILLSDYKFQEKENAGLCNETIYLENLKSTLDLLLIETSKDLEQYEEELDQHLIYLEKKPDSDPTKLFLMAEIRLKYALSLFKFGHEFEAAWHFRQASRNIQRNIKLYPEFIANYKTSGAINILLGSIPEKHQWLLTLVGLNGSIEDGVNQLDLLINSNSNFSYEAVMLKSLLQAYVLNQPELASLAFNKSIDLNGGLIQLQKMVLYLKASESAKALKMFEEHEEMNTLTYSYYLAGDGYIQKGNYSEAKKQYSKFLELYKGSSNIKDTLYKIWLCQYLSDDTQHLNYYNSARSAPEGTSESDKYASRVLNNNDLPNKQIMKLRLATDGGFYSIAEDIISDHPKLLSRKDSVEYDYRMARFFHKKGDQQSSIDLYKSVLNNTNDEHWYFAPNSALMLGYIYIENNNFNLAKTYLNKVKDFKRHEYKNSIDAKAEAALNTISDH